MNVELTKKVYYIVAKFHPAKMKFGDIMAMADEKNPDHIKCALDHLVGWQFLGREKNPEHGGNALYSLNGSVMESLDTDGRRYKKLPKVRAKGSRGKKRKYVRRMPLPVAAKAVNGSGESLVDAKIVLNLGGSPVAVSLATASKLHDQLGRFLKAVQ